MRGALFPFFVVAAACGSPQEEPPRERAGTAEVEVEPTVVAGVEAPARRAEPAAEDVCEGDGATCFQRALPLIAGQASSDPARGWAMVRRSCELGYGTACYDLAIAHVNGNEHVASDLAEYVRLVERACQHGSPDGCNELATPPRSLARSCAQGFREHCALRDHLRARE